MELSPLGKVLFALGNRNRIMIFDLCLRKKYNITEISKKIDISYKATLDHLKVLENAEMISREQQATKKAKETFIKSIPFKKTYIGFKVFEELKKESKKGQNRPQSKNTKK